MNVKMFDSYPQALDALAARLKRRTFDPTDYHIVLTPDRYTLRTESVLFAGSGAIDLEVLTLSRLCRRVLPSDKVLSREGRVMLMARAISHVSDRLTYYKRAARYRDFARSVSETLMQISASDAQPAELAAAATGATAAKLNDLALIKAEYDALKAEYADSTDRLYELIDAAKDAPLVKGAHFYAIGYANATKLNKCVFEAIAGAAKSFEFFDAMPQPPRAEMTVLSAPDRIVQYKSVAADIRDYVYKGGRYGDVSVICGEPRALSRILLEYGIDFYADSTRSLAETPPLAALYALYRIKTEGDAGSVSAFAKNPFSGCDRRDAEMLEAYLAARGIAFDALGCEPDEEGAKRAIAAVRRALAVFDGKATFPDACEAVMDACDFGGVHGRLFPDGTDMIKPLVSLIELLRRYGCGEPAEDAEAFFSAARAVDVKSVPRTVDRVSVCMPQSLRLERCKRLYIVDFNEGVLPQSTPDAGFLSDAELIALGGSIEPTVREKNRRDRAELASVIANAGEVVCAYSTAGGAKRSSFIPSCADRITERDCTDEYRVLKRSAQADYVARFACTAPAAREIAARGMSIYAQSIAEAAGKTEGGAAPFEPSVGEITLRSLSVSELSHWFDCPYKRFLADSVGLTRRRSDGGTEIDFGLIIHEFMRRYMAAPERDCSRAAVERIVDGVLSSGDYPACGAAQRERIIRDACDYCARNEYVLASGGYVPVAEESEFSGDIRLGKAEVPFSGTIDRVDACGERVRVIDYKTGKKKFELNKCLDGRDMQLPLYAAELEATGKAVTGAFYMPLGDLYNATGDALSGFMLKDADAALEYDGRLKDGVRRDIISARLALDGDGNVAGVYGSPAGMMEKAAFDALKDRCVQTASRAADEISSGYIDRVPASGACRRCAYYPLCDKKNARGCASEEE